MLNIAALNERLVMFEGCGHGAWRVTSQTTLCGEPLAAVTHITMHIAPQKPIASAGWFLTGVRSNRRYESTKEKATLLTKSEGLGRPEATRGALIPIKKSSAWWELSQEERRDIFEQQSQHIAYSLNYIPAIARRLHHCRDIGGEFDFLTWFEYAPPHAKDFDDLVHYLRQTKEWEYVEREIDIRVTLD